VRELVLVARHLDAFPEDGLHGALADVFDADAEDKPTSAILANVLAEHGLHALALELRRGRRQGDTSLQLEERSTEFGGKAEKKPPPMPDGGPKRGEWDGKPHVGGNKYAGGTGGTGTAGLGGRAGPYRLDVGQRVHMLSEAEKAEGVSQEAVESAKRMADEASSAPAHRQWKAGQGRPLPWLACADCWLLVSLGCFCLHSPRRPPAGEGIGKDTSLRWTMCTPSVVVAGSMPAPCRT
jgi:hypothetical protein